MLRVNSICSKCGDDGFDKQFGAYILISCKICGAIICLKCASKKTKWTGNQFNDIIWLGNHKKQSHNIPKAPSYSDTDIKSILPDIEIDSIETEIRDSQQPICSDCFSNIPRSIQTQLKKSTQYFDSWCFLYIICFFFTGLGMSYIIETIREIDIIYELLNWSILFIYLFFFIGRFILLKFRDRKRNSLIFKYISENYPISVNSHHYRVFVYVNKKISDPSIKDENNVIDVVKPYATNPPNDPRVNKE